MHVEDVSDQPPLMPLFLKPTLELNEINHFMIIMETQAKLIEEYKADKERA
jgi:hypothetical protein